MEVGYSAHIPLWWELERLFTVAQINRSNITRNITICTFHVCLCLCLFVWDYCKFIKKTIELRPPLYVFCNNSCPNFSAGVTKQRWSY